MSLLAFIIIAFALVCAVLSAPVALEKRLTHTGRGTWFDVGLGACGKRNVNSDKIVAISSHIYGSGGNCEQVSGGVWVRHIAAYIHMTNTANGKSAWGLVRDECPGCGEYDLDLSPSLFEELGNLDQGVLALSWHYENKNFVLP